MGGEQSQETKTEIINDTRVQTAMSNMNKSISETAMRTLKTNHNILFFIFQLLSLLIIPFADFHLFSHNHTSCKRFPGKYPFGQCHPFTHSYYSFSGPCR